MSKDRKFQIGDMVRYKGHSKAIYRVVDMFNSTKGYIIKSVRYPSSPSFYAQEHLLSPLSKLEKLLK